jgi:hypothetical protein
LSLGISLLVVAAARGELAPEKAGTGAYPKITIDAAGNVHLVYARGGMLRYHVGDRFFAANWPSEQRQRFLDWAGKQGYHMLSIASHYLNRDAPDRGRPWATPALLPLNPAEYRRMEGVLDDLAVAVCAQPVVVVWVVGCGSAEALVASTSLRSMRVQHCRSITVPVRPASPAVDIDGSTAPDVRDP